MKKDGESLTPEFLKKCPICEHSDPELERELRAFAQLLFEIYLDEKQKDANGSDTKLS